MTDGASTVVARCTPFSSEADSCLVRRVGAVVAVMYRTDWETMLKVGFEAPGVVKLLSLALRVHTREVETPDGFMTRLVAATLIRGGRDWAAWCNEVLPLYTLQAARSVTASKCLSDEEKRRVHDNLQACGDATWAGELQKHLTNILFLAARAASAGMRE